METYPYARFRELLYDTLSTEDVELCLVSVGFTDWRSTLRRFHRIADAYQIRPTLAEMLPYLMLMLEGTANPDAVIVYLERFLNRSTDPQATVKILATNPRSIDILVRLFTGSQFLTEILLHHPEYFTQLVTLPHLAAHKSTCQLRAEIDAFTATLPSAEPDAHMDFLRQFQRREFLRIGVCDLLDLYDLPAVTLQLSNLADSLVTASLDLASTLTGISTEAFAVLAMGKLCGSELNYSSDIDLLFVALKNADVYRPLGEKLIDILTRMTSEGFLYRVDMRLRPWGRSGSLITACSGYLKYLETHARLWEKQALLKARVIAGDVQTGDGLLLAVTPMLFNTDPQTIRTDVFRMKKQTEHILHQRGLSWGEVKLGEGSIRDVEFVIQYLQMAYGRVNPGIRSGNSFTALENLRAHELLLPYEYRILREGYVFLRTVEHHLQMMHYHQTHSLPASAEALAHLARRLGFEGKDSTAQFLERYTQHREAIRALYLHHLRGDMMDIPGTHHPLLDDSTHITRMDASYTTVFSQDEIRHHTSLAMRLDHDNLVEIHIVPREGGQWIVTIVAFDYPGELSLI
ncbi:MAG: glutamine synthetase adenylyltransferase, partial [Anaerolineales bacterium]